MPRYISVEARLNELPFRGSPFFRALGTNYYDSFGRGICAQYDFVNPRSHRRSREVIG